MFLSSYPIQIVVSSFTRVPSDSSLNPDELGRVFQHSSSSLPSILGGMLTRTAMISRIVIVVATMGCCAQLTRFPRISTTKHATACHLRIRLLLAPGVERIVHRGLQLDLLVV